MILLGFDSVEVNGVIAYPDHINPHQYWYLTADVHLAERNNNVVFTLIKYRPDAQRDGAKGGGFLTCEVDLSLDESTKKTLERTILNKFEDKGVTQDNLLLSPVPYDSGKVGVSALNVEKDNIWTAASPSLSGNNTAILSLNLDQDQATLLDEAYKNEAKPVGINYELEFTGFRPALNMKVTADYSAISNAFQTKFQGSIPLDQAGINRFRLAFDSELQWLQEKGHLKIEVLDSDPKHTEKRKKWALDYVKEQLLRDFFVRQLKDMPELPDPGTPKSEELMDKLAQNMKALAETTKETLQPTPLELGSLQFRYNRKEEKKTFVFEYNESKAVKKSHFPQSFFGALLKDIPKEPPYFLEIDLDDPFFKTLDIEVQAPLDSYGEIGLTSAQIVLKYDGEQRDFYFDSGKPKEQKGKFNINSELDTAYKYQVQYHFAAQSGWEGPISYSDPDWHVTKDRILTLMPQEQMTFLMVKVNMTDDFNWRGIRATKVSFTHSSTRQSQTLLFTKKEPKEQCWKLRVPEPNAGYYTYQVEYVMDSGLSITHDPSTVNVSSLLIADPPNRLNVKIMPSGIDWDMVDAVEVYLHYEDPKNGINSMSSDPFTFTSDSSKNEAWSVTLADNNMRTYSWRAIYYMSDGAEIKYPSTAVWEKSSGSFLFLKKYVPKS